MTSNYYDPKGRPVRLGREIASAGEGRIVEVVGSPPRVAKLYHSGKKGIEPEKLATLIAAGSDELFKIAAWPMFPLHKGAADGPLVGFVMPRFSGRLDIHNLFGPEDRIKNFPDADWRTLTDVAIGCSEIFDAIHRRGFVIGDVNQKNLLVAADASVRIVDCDSFQIKTPGGRTFRCNVGVPGFRPPELQNADLSEVDREANHDRFGLAVMIFQLLIMGRHPYQGRGVGDIDQAIAKNRFAYTRNHAYRMCQPPPGAPTLDVLPFSLAELFERAFEAPKKGRSRPTAEDWRSELVAFRAALKRCPDFVTHYYHPISRRCPWCALTARNQVPLFRDVPVPGRRPAAPPPPTSAGPEAAPNLSAGVVLVFAIMVLLALLLVISPKPPVRQPVPQPLAVSPPVVVPVPAPPQPVEIVEVPIPQPAETEVEQRIRRALQHLRGQQSDWVLSALVDLREIGPPAAEAVPMIVELLRRDRFQDSYSFNDIPYASAAALDEIDPAWRDQYGPQLVADLLLQFREATHPAYEARAPVDEQNILPRRLVVRVLGLLGPMSRPATPDLISLLSYNRHRTVRAETMQALDRIDPNWRATNRP